MKASLRCLLVVVLVGDFDLDEDAFEELRRLGYSAVPDNQPTSLRRRRRDGPGDYLVSESANIFYETALFWGARSGVLDRTARFSSLTNLFGETSGPATSWVSAFHPLPHRFETRKEAQGLSDHLPICAGVQAPCPCLSLTYYSGRMRPCRVLSFDSRSAGVGRMRRWG